MTVYRRGGVYWFDFYYKGERHRKSTHQSDRTVAINLESEARSKLAKIEGGLLPPEPKVVPTLAAFEKRFTDHVKVHRAAKPATVEFYLKKLRRLLAFNPLASARLDQIDEPLVELYIQFRRAEVSPGSVNRELATLKKLLRWAYAQKVITRVPVIHKLDGEGHRDFILTDEAEPGYLNACPQPLRDAATLLLETGMRVGELRSLQWPDVHLEPMNGATRGYIRVRQGKTRNAKRNLSLTERARRILEARRKAARCAWVFTNEKGNGPLSIYTLDSAHARVRAALRMPKEFVLHSLRHTFGSRLAESGADSFTIMKAMGHCSVVVSEKYIHTNPARVEASWKQLEARNKAQAKRVTAKAVKARRRGAGHADRGPLNDGTVFPTPPRTGLVM